MGTHRWAIKWACPRRPTFPCNPQIRGQKAPFKISANQLGVVENVTRAHLKTHWLAANWWAMNNRTGFAKVPNYWIQIEHNVYSRQVVFATVYPELNILPKICCSAVKGTQLFQSAAGTPKSSRFEPRLWSKMANQAIHPFWVDKLVLFRGWWG